MKRCPGCNTRKEREAFYDEPTDTVTGLSALCIECIEGKRKKARKRSVAGWHTTSPAGLHGDVLNVREEESAIVVRFRGARTVVLPMHERFEKADPLSDPTSGQGANGKPGLSDHP